MLTNNIMLIYRSLHLYFPTPTYHRIRIQLLSINFKTFCCCTESTLREFLGEATSLTGLFVWHSQCQSQVLWFPDDVSWGDETS